MHVWLEAYLKKQKLLIVDEVLELNKKLKTLEYILEQAKLDKNKVALKIFDELFEFIYLLLWESMVLNIGWLFEKTWYEKNGKRIRKNKVRSLYWYLEEQKKSFPSKVAEFDSQLVKIDKLGTKVKKVRSIRNKLVAHRDKVAFKDPSKYISEINLNFGDVKILIETAHEIIWENFPASDTTSSGIHRLFWVIDYVDLLPEKIEEIKQEVQ